MDKTTDQATMLTDIARSGLSAAHAHKLKFTNLSPERAAEFGVPELRAYVISYFDLAGKVLSGYWRVRYLEMKRGAFGGTRRKPVRYAVTKEAVPRFYLPPLLEKPWGDYAGDATESLVITEGEKKAAKACVDGLPCISIPGIWAWRSKRHGLLAVPDFDLFKWAERRVYLCFDNLIYDSPNIKAGVAALGRELTMRGAKVVIKYLPRGGARQGLDDYLMGHTTAEWLKLPEEVFQLAQGLWELNEEVIYIRNVGLVYSNVLGAVMSREQFMNGEYSDRFHLETHTDEKGKVTSRRVKTAKTWMEWRMRSKVQNICYRPGADAITKDDCLNLWTGLKVEPEQGDLVPFHKLIDYLCPEEGARRWLMQWLAYPLQHPGTKLYTAVMMQSVYQGNGKSFLGYIIGDIYGDNFIKIGARQLHSDFNTWCANKQFILGEEIAGTEKRSEADNLKTLITQESLLVNNKFEKEYVLDDCANYYLTSNHIDALFLEVADRRLFVQSVTEPPLPTEFYNKTLDAWRRAGGAKALLYHLLNEVDCSDFSPRGAAPSTVHKEDMIHFSKSDIDLFCERLMVEPDAVLRFGNSVSKDELMTATELLRYCESKHVTAAGLGRILQRNRVRCKRVRVGKSVLALYAVRNRRKWHDLMDKGDIRAWAEQREKQDYESYKRRDEY